jgi:hypothetical protein
VRSENVRPQKRVFQSSVNKKREKLSALQPDVKTGGLAFEPSVARHGAEK